METLPHLQQVLVEAIAADGLVAGNHSQIQLHHDRATTAIHLPISSAVSCRQDPVRSCQCRSPPPCAARTINSSLVSMHFFFLFFWGGGRGGFISEILDSLCAFFFFSRISISVKTDSVSTLEFLMTEISVKTKDQDLIARSNQMPIPTA